MGLFASLASIKRALALKAAVSDVAAALAGKEPLHTYRMPIIVSRTGNPLGSWSSASEGLLIPVIEISPTGPLALGANDTLYVEAQGSLVSSANTKNVYCRIGTNSNGLSNTAYRSPNGTTVSSWAMCFALKNLGVRNVNQLFDYSAIGASTSPFVYAIDFSLTQYISFSGKDAGWDAVKLNSLVLQVIKGGA